MTKLPKFYLASRSPRRRELLLKGHFEFELLDIDVSEDFPSDLAVENVAEYLAVKKARAAAPLVPGQIVLTADSVVIKEGLLYGKPDDRDEAIDFISKLAGSAHTVITGVCLMRDENFIAMSDRTTVHMAPCTAAEIEWYVDHYEPFDKAGAYGVQDWIGHCKVTRIEGNYNNVMGLPTAMVYEALQHFRSSEEVSPV